MNEVFAWREAPHADFAVIGHPISHSLSPKMHNSAFHRRGLISSYEAVEVAPGEVAEALDHLVKLGYRGVNVTVPHKEEAFAWCSGTTAIASRLRVCNTLDLEKRFGTNTDGIGFMESLSGLPLTGKSVLILGAGGSARSVILALEQNGFEVSLWNRTASRAEDLVRDFGFSAKIVTELSLARFDLIVNTTSASLGGHRLPIDWKEAKPTAVAYDLAYGKDLPIFLLDAHSHGLAIQDGRRMLMEQGAAAFEFWWGLPAPKEEMLAALQ